MTDRIDNINKGTPPILLGVPCEPGNGKLGSDIFVSLPSASSPSTNELRFLGKISPIVAGLNESFIQELQRSRIYVRRDIDVNDELSVD